MEAFTLDTSGVVPWLAPNGDPIVVGGHRWSDLTPFAQGYIGAALESLEEAAIQRAAWAWRNDKDRETDGSDGAYFRANWRSLPGLRAYVALPAFRHLAPETLAAMLKDCEAYRGRISTQSRQLGRLAWKNRAAGYEADAGFPPVTLYLGDDGLIYQREGR